MGNCLLTKLKGVVDNDSLRKLGSVRVKALETFSYGMGVMPITGESVLVKGSDGSEVTITGDQWFPITAGVTYEIGPDVKLSGINAHVNSGATQIHFMNSCVNLKELRLSTWVYADELPIGQDVSAVIFSYINVVGDFDKFLAFMNRNPLNSQCIIQGIYHTLTPSMMARFGGGQVANMEMTDGGHEGNLEDFVRTRRTEFGQTSGSVRFRTNQTDLKFNGASIGNVDDNIVWTADTITYNGITVNA